MAGITQEQWQAQLDAQVKAAQAKGPTYSAKEIRTSEQPFQQAVQKWIVSLEEERAGLVGKTEPKAVRRRALLEGNLPRVSWLLSRHDAAHRALDKAQAVYDVAAHARLVYTPEQRMGATVLADEIVRLRTAGSDVTNDGTEASKVLRSGLRIGAPLHRANPHDVWTEGQALLLSLHGPGPEVEGAAADADRARSAALREGLEERGIILDAFVPDVEEAAQKLFELLESGVATKKNEARVELDRAQVEVEQINARILATANALGGLTMRDALRDLLPTTTQAPKAAASETPASPGPVVSGEADAPVVETPEVPLQPEA